jgi:hypothetical protein
LAADAGVTDEAVLSPEPNEIRPPLAATVSFVMTGVFDGLRFVRFASATSGESSADAKAATRHRAIVVRSMIHMITPWRDDPL